MSKTSAEAELYHSNCSALGSHVVSSYCRKAYKSMLSSGTAKIERHSMDGELDRPVTPQNALNAIRAKNALQNC